MFKACRSPRARRFPHLSKNGGAIVNISSTLARASVPGVASYSGSKAAVERFASALAVELGPLGIRINSVAPGLTKSDMSDGVPQEMIDGMAAQTHLGRIGQSEDIVRAVAFLAKRRRVVDHRPGAAEQRWPDAQVIPRRPLIGRLFPTFWFWTWRASTPTSRRRFLRHAEQRRVTRPQRYVVVGFVKTFLDSDRWDSRSRIGSHRFA